MFAAASADGWQRRQSFPMDTVVLLSAEMGAKRGSKCPLNGPIKPMPVSKLHKGPDAEENGGDQGTTHGAGGWE